MLTINQDPLLKLKMKGEKGNRSFRAKILDNMYRFLLLIRFSCEV